MYTCTDIMCTCLLINRELSANVNQTGGKPEIQSEGTID